MSSIYGMPELEKQVKKLVEEAYVKLNEASNLMDTIDTVEATKIVKVRKQVLNLLQVELSL